MMTLKNINWGKVVFWGFILLTVILACLSCNPVKKVLKDENKMREVWERGVLKDWCKTDSFVKFLPGRIDSIPYPVPITKKVLDTTALKAAIKRAIDSSDHECMTGMELSYTAGYNDAIEKIGKQKFADKKPDTLKTTKYDVDKERLQQKEISKLLDDQIKLKQQIVNIEAEKKALKKDRNKWRLYFFLLLGGIGAVIGLLIGWKVKTVGLSTLLKFGKTS